MASPQIPQGVLNRLLTSVTWNSFPILNVTAPFLDRGGIALSFEGQATSIIDTLTGTVISPEPYQRTTVRINLLKTQFLAQLYEQQRQLNSALGAGTVRGDAFTLAPYPLVNCAIMNVGELTFNGESAGYGAQITGYLPLNSALWG
jgi:hypothetical protein